MDYGFRGLNFPYGFMHLQVTPPVFNDREEEDDLEDSYYHHHPQEI
jgi:hypothetical protein